MSPTVGALTSKDLDRPLRLRCRDKEWELGTEVVSIQHSASYPAAREFGSRNIIGRETARHTFQVLLGSEGGNEGEEWDLIRSFERARWEEDRETGAPRFVAAQLRVFEWSELQRCNACSHWLDVLDSHSADAEILYPFVSEITEGENFDAPLSEGSLFLLNRLHVHPALRGQNLGIRLIAHATLELQRTYQDVFVCRVMPIKSMFAVSGQEPDKSPAQVEKMTRYYERLGFERWVGESGDARILWHVASKRLPFAD